MPGAARYRLSFRLKVGCLPLVWRDSMAKKFSRPASSNCGVPPKQIHFSVRTNTRSTKLPGSLTLENKLQQLTRPVRARADAYDLVRRLVPLQAVAGILQHDHHDPYSVSRPLLPERDAGTKGFADDLSRALKRSESGVVLA